MTPKANSAFIQQLKNNIQTLTDVNNAWTEPASIETTVKISQNSIYADERILPRMEKAENEKLHLNRHLVTQ